MNPNQTSEQFQQIKRTENQLIQQSLCDDISYTATAEKIQKEQIKQHSVWYLLVHLSYRETESEKSSDEMILCLYNQYLLRSKSRKDNNRIKIQQ